MSGEQKFSNDPVLVIVEVLEIMDADAMVDYVAAIAPQTARYGARNIAAGLETYLGETDAINMVVSYWPSANHYAEWQMSEEYAPLKDVRIKSARIRTHFLPVVPGSIT